MGSKKGNKDSGLEPNVSIFADISTVQSLDTPLEKMNAISHNLWLCIVRKCKHYCNKIKMFY